MLRWITPASPFDVMYVRRFYVLSLAMILVLFGTVSGVQKIILALLIVSAFAGFLTRVSLLAAVILSVKAFHLEPFANHWLDYFLDFGLILACARSSDVLSADGQIQAHARADRGNIQPPAPSIVYGWALKILVVYGLLALVLGWRSIEASGPFARLAFASFLMCAMVPWRKWTTAVGRRMFPHPVYVIYDGNCKLCRRTAAFFLSVDELDRLIFVNGMDPKDLRQRGLHHLDPVKVARDMHVICDAKVFVGFYGYRQIARRIPILWLTVPFLYVWPIPALAQKIYRKVADARGCSVLPSIPSVRGTDPAPTRLEYIAPAVMAAALLAGHLLRL